MRGLNKREHCTNLILFHRKSCIFPTFQGSCEIYNNISKEKQYSRVPQQLWCCYLLNFSVVIEACHQIYHVSIHAFVQSCRAKQAKAKLPTSPERFAWRHIAYDCSWRLSPQAAVTGAKYGQQALPFE